MRVARIPIDDPRWLAFTASHASASPFHLPAWASLIAECYRFDAFVLAALDTDGEILAGVPTVAARSPLGRLRWISLPFSDSCPVLARPDVAVVDVFGAVKDYALAGKAWELEIRTGGLSAAQGVYPVEVGYRHVLELPGNPADLHLSKGHRQHRNRAIRNGVQVVRGTSAEDVATFYRLHTLTRRKHGVPVQPRRFFDLIGDRLLAHGHGFVATATLDGDAVASGLYLTHNGTMVMKYRASNPDRMDTRAVYLVDWETMAAACTEGYHTLDLGRTDPDGEGLRQYKAGWGSKEAPLAYTHISRQPPPAAHPSVGSFAQEVIRRAPVWVCRVLGESLYRWTA